MKTVFYRILDERNAGDMVCSPHFYFDAFKACEQRDIREWRADPDAASIFGGGGLLYHELHDVLSGAAQARKEGRTGPIIIWGAGENMHGQTALLEPSYLRLFDLVGLRDWGHGLASFVPCPSVMSPLFDDLKEVRSVFPVVIYEHFEAAIPASGFPRMTNHTKDGSFENRLKFLAQGEIVFTNTYHGAYWAMLLGRRVAIYHLPKASRLHHFKGQPVMLGEDWIFNLHKADKIDQVYHFRMINEEFCERVLAIPK